MILYYEMQWSWSNTVGLHICENPCSRIICKTIELTLVTFSVCPTMLAKYLTVDWIDVIWCISCNRAMYSACSIFDEVIFGGISLIQTTGVLTRHIAQRFNHSDQRSTTTMSLSTNTSRTFFPFYLSIKPF